MTEAQGSPNPIDDYKTINAAIKEINARWEAIDFGMPGHKPEEVLEDLGLLIHGANLLLRGEDLDSPPPDWKKILKASPIPATSLASLIDEPIPYVVKPILVRGSLTQLQGVPKGGKSAFSVYLSLCAATGLWPTPQYLTSESGDPLKVVYITWEDPEIMMAKRLSLYAAGLGLDRKFLPTGLTFLFGPDIFVERGNHVAAMKACIRELGPDIVVVDTLSHIHLCEENASSEMKIPMKNLARVAKDENVSIMYLHHTAKGSGDKLTQDKGRGSGAIAAAWHVLIDWGVREKGSHINPVEVQSKYEHKFKYWNISYHAEEDDSENVSKVSWAIDSQDRLSKKDPTSGNKRRSRILQVFQNTKTSKEWMTSLEVTQLSNLGLDERSMRRHLQKMCQDGDLESKYLGPHDHIHYKLIHQNGAVSSTGSQ